MNWLFVKSATRNRQSAMARRMSTFGLKAVAAIALSLAPSAAHACTVCFGNSDSKLTQGMLAGVLVLLLVILSVLGGFVALFIYLARRAAAVAALENQSTPTDSTVHS
jgi:hypothetical protein